MGIDGLPGPPGALAGEADLGTTRESSGRTQCRQVIGFGASLGITTAAAGAPPFLWDRAGERVVLSIKQYLVVLTKSFAHMVCR